MNKPEFHTYTPLPNKEVTKSKELDLKSLDNAIVTWPEALTNRIAQAASKRGLRADLV